MNFKRFLCAVMTVLMVMALIPTAVLAEEIGAAAAENAKLAQLDRVWAVLEEVEADAIASGANMSAVTMAVYKAAAQLELVDENSFNSLTNKSFFFTVDGMACAYDYVARNIKDPGKIENATIVIPGTKNGPTNMNVLLVGPYYGYDSSFTAQYRNEAQDIASVTGGDYILLSGHDATGPAIAENAPDAGVVIYDSHGTQSGTSSYLCLTTNQGITSEDYSNGWAVSSGSAAFIDGRYVQHHIASDLPNNIFWMAICEGMKRQGQGTTGYALLDAGAGCVYGYSQSVTFVGDYMYEATFWNEMKYNDATVAEAFDVMIATHGEPDPRGDAWAIVMSPDDPFPANPDSHQDVNCDWQLFGGNMEPVALESWTLSENAVEIYASTTASVAFNRIPDNANQYELVWQSENEAVATVNGNNKRVTITGVAEGNTNIYCEVFDLDGNLLGTAYCAVNVLGFPTFEQAANVMGGHLTFENATPNYPWTAVLVDGRAAVKSGGAGIANVTSTLKLTLAMEQGETLTFDWKASCEGSSYSAWDNGKFYVNGTQFGDTITGAGSWTTVTYTANTTGTFTFEWKYTKDSSVNSNDDCIYVDNVAYSGDEISSITPGDLDGDGVVTSGDALIILRIVLEMIDFTDEQYLAADYNGDGTVDTTDALEALRFAMGALN